MAQVATGKAKKEAIEYARVSCHNARLVFDRAAVLIEKILNGKKSGNDTELVGIMSKADVLCGVADRTSKYSGDKKAIEEARQTCRLFFRYQKAMKELWEIVGKPDIRLSHLYDPAD